MTHCTKSTSYDCNNYKLIRRSKIRSADTLANVLTLVGAMVSEVFLLSADFFLLVFSSTPRAVSSCVLATDFHRAIRLSSVCILHLLPGCHVNVA
jgi:hypothetical protein